MVFGKIVSFQCHFGLLLEMVNGFCVWNQLTRLVSNGQAICIVDLVLRMVHYNNNHMVQSIWSMCECECACLTKFRLHSMYIFIHASRLALVLWLYQSEPLICVCPTSIFITFYIETVIYKWLPLADSDAKPFSLDVHAIYKCSCVLWGVKWSKLLYH